MRTKIIFLILINLILNTNAQQTDVMLQGFNWASWSNTTKWYEVVNSKAGDLKTIGINGIWLPPPSKTADKQGYIPTVWYDLNTNYGTELQLKSLINNLHANNIKAIADIVINHRGGSTGWYDFSTPSWNTPTQTWSIVKNSCLNSTCSQTGSGNWDYDPVSAGLKSPGESGLFSAARDLDHSNIEVRTGIKNWMNWLKNTIGFDGWRYDFVHGYDGKYIKDYNNATNPYFSVGELLEGDRNRIIRWLDNTKDGSADANSSAFDFATKSVLQNAFNDNNLSYLKDGSGKASGLIGVWPSKAITMLDNHDTGSTPNQGHWTFPGQHVVKGYAYILTHPGIPMIFWDHLYNWGTAVSDPIRTFVSIRKRNGIHNTSSLNIITAQQNLYAAIIDNKVAMKLGSGDWSPGLGWTIAASGDQYAIWEKNNTPVMPTLTISPVGGTFEADTTQAVNLSAPNATIYYTLNGTEPTTTSLSFANSGTLNISTNTTLKAFAKNNAGQSLTQTQNYQFVTIGSFSVYFKKPTSWTGSVVNVHYWNKMPGTTASTWPGVLTTLENGWYKYTFNNTSSTQLLFNNGGNGSLKTIDLNRNKDGWYKDGIWYDTNPEAIIPVLSVSLPSGTYSSPQNMTLSATPDAMIYYTLNGTEPTISSPSFTNSGTLNISTNTTLKVFAKNSIGQSEVKSYTYNFASVGSFKVYFWKPSNWTGSQVNIHYWNKMPGTTASTWPGVVTTLENDGWYSYTFNNTSSTQLLFNNGGNGSTKTIDLSRNKDGWYKDGVWYDTKPVTPNGLTVHFNKPTHWTTAKIYYWNVLPAGCAPSINWPGVNMISENDNNWFKYTIGTCTSANLIFNNGSGSQTVDLFRNAEGWYKDNSWYNSKPLISNQSISGIVVQGSKLIYKNTFNSVNTLTLDIINLNGQTIKSYSLGKTAIGSNTYSMDITMIAKGVYLLKANHLEDNNMYNFIIN